MQRWIFRFIAALFVCLLVGSPWARGAEKNRTIADPEEAKKDAEFVVQGEYVGEVEYEGEKKKVGVQVIALGDNQYRGVRYMGGLPGAGWDGGDKKQAEGKVEDGVVTFRTDDHVATLSDGVFTVKDKGGKVLGTVRKTHRESSTLGAKPPAGAVVLWDGTKETLEKMWKKGARMTDDGLLMEGATSVPTFGDFTLHVEFRTPFQPGARGQGRGNSGVYMQGRFETQVLDSFGLKGENNECGGIYSIKAPDVNMCLPPLSWQTYDVDFTAAKFDAAGKKTAHAKMTVKHNGVLIHKDVELDHATTASPVKEGPEPGPIYQQNHGNPVRYRNIWLVPKN